MNKNIVCCALLTGVSFSVLAAQSRDSDVAAYYVSQNFDVDGDDTDGDGFGFSANISIPLSNSVSVYIPSEYNHVKYDENSGFLGFDLNETRLGVGLLGKISPVASMYGGARYVGIKQKIDDGFGDVDLDGFALFAGAKANISPTLKIYGEASYVKLKEDDTNSDIDGPEFTVGAQADFGGPGVFAEYRLAQISGDDDTDLDLSSMRLGVRFSF